MLTCIFAVYLNLSLICPDCLSVPLLNISDGDTIVVLLHNKKTKIRLYGIDAPESKQEYGRESSQTLQSLLAGQRTVSIKPITEDRHKRIVGLVFVDGQNINEAMIAEGSAWMFRKYCHEPFCAEWLRIEEQARQARRGLWQAQNPIPPWDWRHPPADPEDIGKFSANVKSRVFHRHTCTAFRCKNCTQFFTDRQQAIDAGFKPCGMCKP